MKKPNRIARKGDTARTRAQAKHRATSPAKPKAAQPAKPRQSGEEALAAAVGLKESPYGEHVCEVEHGQNTWQTLYRRGNLFTLVDSSLAVRVGRVWRTWEEWAARNPGVSDSTLPKSQLRRYEIPEKLARCQVIAWLGQHFGRVAIPEEFAEDFRPAGVAWQTTPDDARRSFFHLADVALSQCTDAEEQPGIAGALMHIATALGLKEEAATAAKILNCHNASMTASYALTDMIEAARAGKS